MPLVWTIFGFSIYFWSNENNEPIHFHISKGIRGANNTKFWLYSDGTIHLDHNSSRYKKQEIAKIIDLQYYEQFVKRLQLEWQLRFGYISYVQ